MRILFKLIIFIVIFVIAGLIALPFIVDPNDYKQEISSQVEKATGRTLILDGDIKLSVFPWIALELGPLVMLPVLKLSHSLKCKLLKFALN